jgi:phosphoribosylglycinamide formyltransferase 1
MNRMPQIAIFASGSGSNTENIIQHFKKTRTAKVALIICNNPNAGVIERAHRLRIPLVTISRRAYENSSLLLHTLKTEEIDFIVLAGFLWKIPLEVCLAYPKKMINVHPALLPKFGGKGMYGMNVHRAVLEAGEKESGITIHQVNEHYDEGDILFQKSISTESCTSAEDLASRIHDLEYEFFPRVIEEQIEKVCK